MENEFPGEITFSLQFMTFIGIARLLLLLLLLEGDDELFDYQDTLCWLAGG